MHVRIGTSGCLMFVLPLLLTLSELVARPTLSEEVVFQPGL
jgi:hypothetical protein